MGAVDISNGPIDPAMLEASWAAGLQRSTLSAAADRADVELRRLDPVIFGEPAAVLVTEAGLAPAAVLLYAPSDALPRTDRPAVGALLGIARGQLVLGKMLGAADYEQVVVDGDPGVWISGPAHQVMWTDADGQFRIETARLAGNTLVWQEGDVTYRFESALDRDAAIAAAEQLR